MLSGNAVSACWRQLRFQAPAKLLNTGRLVVTYRRPQAVRAGGRGTSHRFSGSYNAAVEGGQHTYSDTKHRNHNQLQRPLTLPHSSKFTEFTSDEKRPGIPIYSSAVRSLSTGSQEYDREFQLAHTESAVSCAAYLQAFSRLLIPGAGAVALRDGSGSIRGRPQGCGAILRLHYVSCHTDRSEWWEGSRTRGVNFARFQKSMAGSTSGPTVVPGHPEASLLYKVISTSNEDIRMPFAGQPLSQKGPARIRQWIVSEAKEDT